MPSDNLGGYAQFDPSVAIYDVLLNLVGQVGAPARPHRVAPGVSPEVHLRIRHLLEAQLAHLYASIDRDVRVSWFACSLLLHRASGTCDVPNGYEPPGASTLDRGEVQTQLLRPASGGVRGPGLLSPVSSGGLLGLPCRVLGLLHGPAGRILGLARGVLHALGNLAHLIRNPSQGASAL